MPSRGGSAQVTTDHEMIRAWVEERGGHPAVVKRTRGRGGPGMLRVDYPGYSGEDTLQSIEWDEFFDVFDRRRLAFLHQDTTAEGEQSRFSKLVKRDSAAARGAKRARRAPRAASAQKSTAGASKRRGTTGGERKSSTGRNKTKRTRSG
jgi:hypothetical protein